MTDATLLFELGTEDLPPSLVEPLSTALRDAVVAGLDAASVAHGDASVYATPRRLAVSIANVAGSQPDRDSERRGPAVKAAFDADGNPTKAAAGFARSCGVEVDALERMETDAGAWLVYRYREVGKPLAELVGPIIVNALAKLPIPKRMRWADLDAEFSRPVRWAVLMHGPDVIAQDMMGVTSGAATRGHRFHAPHELTLREASQYATRLRTEGHIEPDFAARRARIETLVDEAGRALGGRAALDPELLDEVTALVEWPAVVSGGFDARYLELPDAVLIASMKGNQRYFHVTGDDGALLAHFITISNIDSTNPESVRSGNERVIRPRLEDADFFYRKDLATPLAERREELGRVLFQDKLGSVLDKSNRVAALAARIAADAMPSATDDARRAGELCKCDLVTEMVGEFPELQGTMGRDYARHAGESEAVAVALEEAYAPRFAGDAIPATDAGRAVALADRLDTLAGVFALGQTPRGDRDPFGLRRAALGVLRILIEAELPLRLGALVDQAAEALHTTIPLADEQRDTLLTFIRDRLRAYFVDAGGAAPDTFAAVATLDVDTPLDFARRIRAVDAFRALPEAAALAAANKRIGNILKQADSVPDSVDAALFTEDAERALHAAAEALRDDVARAASHGAHTEVLRTLSSLRDPVDAFLDGVRVMDDDERVRDNRIALLASVRAMFTATADVGQLQG